MLSKNATSFNFEAEKYVDAYGELIPFFYNNKLFKISFKMKFLVKL